MQFDLLTLLGIAVVALAAIAFYRHRRGGSAAAVDERSAKQRKDVFRALQSMRKD